MKTFDPMAPGEPTVPEIHTEIPNPDRRQRSTCSVCPDVKGGWPCPTLQQYWQSQQQYVWSLRDAILERLRVLYSERMDACAAELEAQGLPDGARRALENAKYADDDRLWTFLANYKEIFEVPGFGHYQKVTTVDATDLNTEWYDWSSPVGLVVTELLKDSNSGQLWNHRYFMITGKNRSHYGTEWDYAQFSEVKPKTKTMMTWEGVH